MSRSRSAPARTTARRRPSTLPVLAAGLVVAAAALWSTQAHGQACGDSVTIDRGDTLHAIAQRCGTTIEALRGANPAVDPRRLIVGATLAVPPLGEATPAERHPEAAARYGADDRLDSARRQGVTHRAIYGETLAEIAARFDTTVPALLASNPELTEETPLKSGQEITIPGLHDELPRSEALAATAGSPRIEVSPRSIGPGGQINVTAWGFPADTELVIGGGPKASEWRPLKTVTSTSRGRLAESVALPAAAAESDTYVIVISRADRLEATSAAIRVNQADAPPAQDALAVTGTLSNEGVECPALRADDGTLYTLAGGTADFSPGDRVRVTGRPVAASICMQGQTLSVEQIAEAGG